MLIKPFIVDDNQDQVIVGDLGINFDDFVKKDGESSSLAIPLTPDMSSPTKQNKSTKSSKKKKKQTKKMPDGNEIVLAEDEKTDDSLQMHQTNDPYLDSYEDTTNMLKVSIGQMVVISSEIKGDLDTIRSSKTLKNKYTHIPNLASTLGTLMATKITAIREINKSITDSHNLELKRIKDLKLNVSNEVDDDKAIMDMYNSFISMPVGGLSNIAPPMTDMSLMTGVNNIVRADVGEGDFNSYINNITPAQNFMRYEQDPNVKTVVVYDQASGRRYFDVMNIQTGESIPNVSKPDQMFLEDTTIDLNNKIARNTNLDQTYPVVVIGDNTFKY